MEFRKAYLDKNGEEIEEGMTIQHDDDGDTEKVYATQNQYGEPDLGVLASNPEYLKRHPDADPEYYPLSEFDLDEWKIVK